MDKIHMDKALTLPRRSDAWRKVVHATNRGVTLQIADHTFELSLSSARDLVAGLSRMIELHAAFADILPDLAIDGRPALEIMAPHTMPAEIDLRLLSPCPCGAGAGQPCQRPDGQPLGWGKIHDDRPAELS